MSVWSLFPFFALLHVSSSTSHWSLLPDHTFDLTLYARLLLKFSDFHLVVHFDNITKDIVNSFLQLNAPPSTIFNYDTTNHTMRRPDGVKCLNVVYFDNPVRFSQYLKHGNILAKDMIMLLTGQTGFRSLVARYKKMLNFSKAGRILVMVYGTQIEIYKVSFYNGKDSGVHLLDRLHYDEFPEVTEQYYPKTFDDFNGHVLKVAYINYFPYMYCTRRNATVCHDAIGSDYELLKILSSTLNFKFILNEVTTSYNSLIQGLVDEKYDFAIGGVSMTVKRRKILQFSDLLKFGEVAVIYKHEMSKLPSIFDGFTPEFSFVVVITSMVTTMIISWIIKYHGGTVDFSKIVMVLCKLTCEQPSRLRRVVHHGTFSIRLVWMSWALFCIVINSALRSQLTSMVLKHPKSHVTLISLLNEGRCVVLDVGMTPMLRETIAPEENAILPKSKILEISNICERMLQVETNNNILIGEVAKYFYHSRLHCAHVFPPKDELFHHLSTIKSHISPLAWPFKTGAPFVAAFNKQIKRAIDGGLYSVLTNRALFDAKIRAHRTYHSGRHSTVNFESFSVHVMTLGGFLMGCVVCFLGELVYHRWGSKL